MKYTMTEHENVTL